MSKKVVTPDTYTLVPEEVPTKTRRGNSVYVKMIDEFLELKVPSVRVSLEPDTKIATVVQGLRKAVDNKPVKIRQSCGAVYLENSQGE